MNTFSGFPKPAGDLVLVVEDETLIRITLADHLRDAGFEVIEAENADVAARELTKSSEIAAVVTDVRMPGSMDGLGLAKWMREHRPAIPIIITSGFSTPPDVQAINPAIVKVTGKPYNSGDIVGLIGTLVQPAEQGQRP